MKIVLKLYVWQKQKSLDFMYMIKSEYFHFQWKFYEHTK